MCRILAPIELTITAGFLAMSAASPTITEEEKPIVAEMQQLVSSLVSKWDTKKAQRLWELSSNKILVEEEKFKKESNNAKCVIGWVLKTTEAEIKAKLASDLVNLTASKSEATAPTAVASASVPTTDVNQTRVFSW